MATNPERAMRSTQDEIESARLELLAMGCFPISGGEQTADEIAAEAEAKRLADEEAKRIADEEKNLSDAGKLALKNERDARKAAAKRAADAEAELEVLRTAKAKADEDKRKQDEADAIKKGEFQTLAEQRAEALKDAEAKVATVTAQNATLIAALKPGVDAEWKALPDTIGKLYKGDKDDVVAKRIFLTDHAELIAALSGKDEERKNGYRTPKVPIPNGRGKEPIEDETAALARSNQYKM